MAVNEDEKSKNDLKYLLKMDELNTQKEKHQNKSNLFRNIAIFPFLISFLTLALMYMANVSTAELESFGVCNFLIGVALLSISSNHSSQHRKLQKSIKFHRRCYQYQLFSQINTKKKFVSGHEPSFSTWSNLSCLILPYYLESRSRMLWSFHSYATNEN